MDVNDVTERDAFTSAARGAKYPGVGARTCSDRLGPADQPDRRVAPLSSVVRAARAPPHRAAYGIVSAVAVPVFPGAPLSFSDPAPTSVVYVPSSAH
jgi:hypothetical protein